MEVSPGPPSHAHQWCLQALKRNSTSLSSRRPFWCERHQKPLAGHSLTSLSQHTSIDVKHLRNLWGRALGSSRHTHLFSCHRTEEMRHAIQSPWRQEGWALVLFCIGGERWGVGYDNSHFHGQVVWDSKSTPTVTPVTLSMNLEHISGKPCNNSLKFFFSYKMASVTKRFRNAVSFKLNRFMPLSQTTCRKQCLLYFELKRLHCKQKKEEPSYARDMLTLAFSFAKPVFEFGCLHSECCGLSPVAFCMKSSAEPFQKTWILGKDHLRTLVDF